MTATWAVAPLVCVNSSDNGRLLGRGTTSGAGGADLEDDLAEYAGHPLVQDLAHHQVEQPLLLSAVHQKNKDDDDVTRVRMYCTCTTTGAAIRIKKGVQSTVLIFFKFSTVKRIGSISSI